jgi:hypothetical protein
MSQKSILEQALLQMENFEEAIKQNSKGILSSTMKKEFKNLLESKEEQNEQEVDDETTPDEDEKDVPEVGDETMNDTDEDSSEDEMSDDEDEMSDDEEDEMGMTEPQDDSSDDTLDMTGASDSEVLKVFKSMKPEDGIVVKKDGNNLEIEVSGDEYIIKLDELDEDLSEEEMTEEETSEEEMTEEEMTEEETSEEETVYEIELDEESTEDEESSKKETKESKVKKGEHTEAARTKWNPHGDKGEAKRAGIKSKKVFKSGSGVVSEEFTKLKKQNEEYKKALVLFKDKLNEVAVFNANLAYATRIFTEHSTTKQEKLNILKRFDSVSTMNESKNLFSTIKSELENKKPISESVVDKITSTSKTSSSKDILSESNAYVSPQFARMKDLMKKLK